MTTPAESLHTIPEIVTALRHNQPYYRFDAATQLQDKTAIGLIGPTGIGKTTLSNEVARIDTDITTINTTTTRRRRSDDPERFKTANEGVTYQSMYRSILERKLVNYSVNDDDHIYGTSPADFGGEFAIGPMSSDSVDNLMTAGFRDFFPVVMVAEPDVYRQRLQWRIEQRQEPAEHLEKHLHDSLATLAFARMNFDAQWLSFIDSGDSQEGLEQAARDVTKIAYQRTLPIMTYERRLQLLDDMQQTITDVKGQLR